MKGISIELRYKLITLHISIALCVFLLAMPVDINYIDSDMSIRDKRRCTFCVRLDSSSFILEVCFFVFVLKM